jgi:hypothetical protein
MAPRALSALLDALDPLVAVLFDLLQTRPEDHFL